MSKVGIVLISHSAKVVEGIKEIIRQVVKDVPIETAGGTDENEIGTSMEKIQTAITNANQGVGTLVFYDIGSAKMNAEIAIEMAETDQVTLIEAPILEGAYVGAVEASMDKSLNEICAAVEKAF
ncbi:dihydroxyacetone kinase phosphoryl donor subunit DhaM [Pontibacillus litoralis]|uniref:phosphoenolpyruvate--glycerone phosphotransferase n=1 Tax=Pontibacillus litoralis JSM 072002 TaxID=1385512 RepID=A0A0A5G6C9_9BACI|nr:dihydroxyacetone kinase phosphoryl donor subunit DhaM [Pontibacillus litoralis]KGX87579.1 dihydroxyacetone kinase [Pontibacillus litoralis JSM 072002]